MIGQSMTLIGAGMVAYGCWLASPALGFIVAGVFVSVGGALHYRKKV
jgi:hypothetical protein